LRVPQQHRKKGRTVYVTSRSPKLLTFLRATILNLDGAESRSISYRETDHYPTTKDFWNAPDHFYPHLIEGDTDL